MHLIASEREESFFERLSAYLDCERVIVFLGDFNCVCAPEDSAGLARLRDQSAFFLNDLVARNSLEDVATVASNGNVRYTHFQGYSHARLDRAYVSLDLVPFCGQYAVQPVSFSDHSLVMFTLGNTIKLPRWNWDLWKLNNSLVSDEVFKDSVSKLFKALRENEQEMWVERWELFKEEVKTRAIERSSVMSDQKKLKEKELKRQLTSMLIEESVRPGEFQKDIRNIKNQLEALYAERYRGAVVRARAEKLWFGETPTKRALGYEKRYAQRNEIKRLATKLR